MTDYSVISRYRNKELVEGLVGELRKRGKSCYNFCENVADPHNPDASPEEQMSKVEKDHDFLEDDHHRHNFEKDLEGLKSAKSIILLLPAGTSTHIEAGIAYGLGKHLILVGKPEKQESLYFIFDERYKAVDEFLASID